MFNEIWQKKAVDLISFVHKLTSDFGALVICLMQTKRNVQSNGEIKSKTRMKKKRRTHSKWINGFYRKQNVNEFEFCFRLCRLTHKYFVLRYRFVSLSFCEMKKKKWIENLNERVNDVNFCRFRFYSFGNFEYSNVMIVQQSSLNPKHQSKCFFLNILVYPLLCMSKHFCHSKLLSCRRKRCFLFKEKSKTFDEGKNIWKLTAWTGKVDGKF